MTPITARLEGLLSKENVVKAKLLNHCKVERFFALHLPAGYSIGNDVATPLVLDFHGHGGDSAQQQYSGGLGGISAHDSEKTPEYAKTCTFK